MLLKGNRGFFSSLVISTVAFLELILLWRILRSENHKYEESSCEGVERRLFARSGGLSELAGPLVSKSIHLSLYLMKLIRVICNKICSVSVSVQ